MNNKNALETVAILSSFLSKDNRNYKDLVSPFIIKLLPQKENTIIDVEKIQIGLLDEFGLDIPQKAIQSILKRICKNKRTNLAKVKQNFLIIKPFDTNDFANKRLEIKKQIEEVVKSLLKYYERHTVYDSKYNFEDARQNLIKFYKDYGYIINHDSVGGLSQITKFKDSENYPIARFILHEKEKKSVIYEYIIQITKGFFAYKAIYFFGRGNKESLETKLSEVDFYFDTMILIDMLGYDRADEKKAVNELRKLLMLSGGSLKAFTHNKDEIAGILTLYARDRNSRKTLDLTFFREQKYDSNDAIRLRDALEINLSKLAIKVEDVPGYGVVTDENYKVTGCIGIKEFTDEVKKCYTENGHVPEESNIEADVISIDAISRLRKGIMFDKIEKCKAIFITDNSVILRCANNLVERNKIPLSMSSLDLAALLWLSKYNDQTDLPESLLIESAYAACSPSDELMRTFCEKVEKLEKEGGITNEEALLLRTQETLTEELVDLTQNDTDNLDDDIINEILRQYNEKVKSVERKEKERIMEELRKRDEIKQKKYDDATQKANKKGHSSYCLGIVVLYVIIIAVLVFCVRIVSYEVLNNESHQWYSYVGLAISILALADMIFTKVGFLKKVIKRNSKRVFDNVYAREVEKIEHYYSE